jgi:DNA-binding transcriptional MerR regulator
MEPATLTIGQLARATGAKVETIRFYEKTGLLPAPDRTKGITARTPVITSVG